MTFYTQGTIDEISLNGVLSFSLLPASEFLIHLENGKKILFIENTDNPTNARLLSCGTDNTEKEVVWFSVATDQTNLYSSALLLEAKNNRNIVKIAVEFGNNSKDKTGQTKARTASSIVIL
jgi:hypothetical protein